MFQREVLSTGDVIAIIGNGPSAAATIINLNCQNPNLRKIYWIGTYDRFGVGPVFGMSDLYSEMPNAAGAAKKMGIIAGEEGDFLKWLEENKATWQQIGDYAVRYRDINPEHGYPRHLYSIYLEQKVKEALDGLRAKGVEVELVNDYVEFISPEGEVVCRSGFVVPKVDQAVIAVGTNIKHLSSVRGLYDLNASPLPNFIVSTAGFRYDGDIHGQDIDIIECADEKQEVLIIGSGIAAAGIVKRLSKSGYQGGITLVSASGSFPEVSKNENSVGVYSLSHFSTDNLPSNYEEFLVRFAKEVQEAEKQGFTEHDVIDSLARPIEGEESKSLIWLISDVFDNKDKELLYRRGNGGFRWDEREFRISSNIEKGIKYFSDRGKLKLVEGRIVDAQKDADGFLCRYETKSHDVVDVRVNYVVNAAGQETDINKSSNKLVQALYKAGVICEDSRTKKIQTNQDLSVVSIVPMVVRLYALGPIVDGGDVVTKIRMQGAKIAQGIEACTKQNLVLEEDPEFRPNSSPRSNSSGKLGNNYKQK